MLVYFTDAITEQQIAVNPNYVTAVFVAADGDMKDKTVVGLTNGSVVVKETQIDVVGVLQGQLK
jgi:predicted metal-dependent peptidase